MGALVWGNVDTDATVGEADLEKAEVKRAEVKGGDGWGFAFPPVGGKKKPAVTAASRASV